MRKAFSLLEILLVIIVFGIVIYFVWFNSPNGGYNPFAYRAKEFKTKQQMVDDKLDEIQNSKQLKEQIERKMYEGY